MSVGRVKLSLMGRRCCVLGHVVCGRCWMQVAEVLCRVDRTSPLPHTATMSTMPIGLVMYGLDIAFRTFQAPHVTAVASASVSASGAMVRMVIPISEPLVGTARPAGPQQPPPPHARVCVRVPLTESAG